MKTITLTFDATNNFCPVALKYNTMDDEESIIANVDWLINNAMASIEKSYGEGAPRRIEMTQLCHNLKNQLKSQITQEQIEQQKL